MPFPQSIRSLVPLVVGLAVGGIGATLFQQSLPPAAGSPAERADQLAAELKRATNRIAVLEAAEPSGGRRPGLATQDRLRILAEDLRAGRPVSPDDIFAAVQPVLADLTPLFDRIRLRNQAKMIEAMASELAGRYDLDPQQQAALGQWLEARADDNAKRWNDLVARKDTRLADLIRATHDVRLDDGLDQFMATTLTGDKLTAFNAARMAERAERVQQAADRQVARLDAIVELDDAQRDQVFGLAARSSRDYDPGMKLEGLTGDIGATPAGDRQTALLSVLRPDQRATYETERQRRRAEAAEEAAAIGLTLPDNWNPLDDFDY
jgi:hypothetical protein